VNFAAHFRLLVCLLLLPLGLLSPVETLAVSLGDELILSRLGDPVEVEVEVLQWEDMDLDRVQISAASREEYEVFKLTWLPVLEHLDFNLIGPDLDGNVRVLISSRDPLDEPFLELLLVLRWPGGSLRREYVLLFDPPGAPVAFVPATEPEPAAPAPQPAPRVVALVAPEPDPAPQPEATQSITPDVVTQAPVVEESATQDVVAQEVVVEEPVVQEPDIQEALAGMSYREPPPTPAPQSAPQPAPQPAPSEASSEARAQVAIEVDTVAPQATAPTVTTTRRTYQVRPGDSLWNIARQFRPAGAGENLYQMLVGIHDLNRSSFINGNISLLKANALLQMPTDADIDRIDPAAAQAEFDRRWEAGTQRFDAVQRGEAIPLFVNDLVEEEAPVTIEPELPPGVEAPPPVVDTGLIMVSATNTPLPLQLGTATDTVPVPAARDDAASATPVPDEAGDVVLDLVVVTELETELAAMRTRRETAEALARQLQESLQRAQAQREARNGLLAAENLPLAGGALALLLALIAGVAFMLKLAGELRAVRVEAAVSASLSRNDPPVRRETRTEPTISVAAQARALDARAQDASQIEVVELDAQPATAAMEIPDTPANPQGSPLVDGEDPGDLFARMDNMLETSAQKSPQK
jgi:FimV-like protein